MIFKISRLLKTVGAVIALGLTVPSHNFAAEDHEEAPVLVTNLPPAQTDAPAKEVSEVGEVGRRVDGLQNSMILTNNPQGAADLASFQSDLDFARKQRASNNPEVAEKLLLKLLDSKAPDEVKRPALLEVAFLAQELKQYPKAQQLFSQYTKLYSTDPSAPEILYRQGLLYREMGAPVMALSKFYAVMSSALNLKLNQFDYYQRLVLLSKIEIADTYYLQGKYEEASDYLARLLKVDDKQLNKTSVQYKLIRSMSYLERHADVVSYAKSFLSDHVDSADVPEVRFLLADSLRKLGRNRDAMEQVLVLLQSQQATAEKNPENWKYWQQRTGNDIANQLFKEGDYLSALEIYQNLTKLDSAASWQCPVLYQVGLAYERLEQPEKATQAYDAIIGRSAEVQTNATETLKTLVEMARWRKDNLKWVSKAAGETPKLAISAKEAKVEPAKTAAQ